LRELGYSNHIEVLNAKNYGIPQNRERAFMISILGNYQYKFPKAIPLTLRLKDMLEKNVDEKYYLTKEKIHAISQWKAQQDPLENMENIDKTGISPTLTARGAGEEHSGMVLIKEDLFETKEYANYLTWKDEKGRLNTQDHCAYFEDRLSGTIPAMERGVPNVLKNNLRIRKLTPRECYRLMGFGDEAFNLAQPNQSNSSLYHQAGDSIVVNVLEALFKGLL